MLKWLIKMSNIKFIKNPDCFKTKKMCDKPVEKIQV